MRARVKNVRLGLEQVYSANCIDEIYYIILENSYILHTDASVTTVSGLGIAFRNSVICCRIQDVEMHIFDIDNF